MISAHSGHFFVGGGTVDQSISPRQFGHVAAPNSTVVLQLIHSKPGPVSSALHCGQTVAPGWTLLLQAGHFARESETKTATRANGPKITPRVNQRQPLEPRCEAM